MKVTSQSDAAVDVSVVVRLVNRWLPPPLSITLSTQATWRHHLRQEPDTLVELVRNLGRGRLVISFLFRLHNDFCGHDRCVIRRYLLPRCPCRPLARARSDEV